MRVGALIVAAGRGARMGSDLPKQYHSLGGSPVLARTVARLTAHAAVSELVIVIHPDDSQRAAAALAAARLLATREAVIDRAQVTHGGATRAASVAAGLAAFGAEVTHVLIHDAARPFVSLAVIDRVIAALATGPAAAPAVAVTDALWRDDGTDRTPHGIVRETVPRAGLWRAQTPQGFALTQIRAAHRAAPASAADDVEVARAAGLEVAIVPGDEDNIKLTHPADRARAERLLAEERNAMETQEPATPFPEIRLGNGYDVHRFGPGSAVVLCGIEVPHSRALQGHSDADVGMHAVTDAIYGALAEGDIGRHFPPSDPQWKGAASHIFLEHAVARAAERGFRIGNVDCTLVCEFPKIGPHAPAMQSRMAEVMGLEAGRISVKATTSERLGFTGREEGIAALATVTLIGTRP
ncbi:MAG: bifunctional 2-C-methyl-D-erythritol 4-phosphate cytidylyltransferase/2-C-methyl-D-erythritol 2,4-cyclodiphosphate synthase [Pseudomonadota bacterium]